MYKISVKFTKNTLTRTLLKINMSEGKDVKFTGVISSFIKFTGTPLSVAGMRTG
jgi:hypothetical protein